MTFLSPLPSWLLKLLINATSTAHACPWFRLISISVTRCPIETSTAWEVCALCCRWLSWLCLRNTLQNLHNKAGISLFRCIWHSAVFFKTKQIILTKLYLQRKRAHIFAWPLSWSRGLSMYVLWLWKIYPQSLCPFYSELRHFTLRLLGDRPNFLDYF